MGAIEKDGEAPALNGKGEAEDGAKAAIAEDSVDGTTLLNPADLQPDDEDGGYCPPDPSALSLDVALAGGDDDDDDDDLEDDDEGVQEHLKDAVEATVRLKRILSQDNELLEENGGGISKRRRKMLIEYRVGPKETAKIRSLMTKWGVPDDAVTRHVLEGMLYEELEQLEGSGYIPDRYNMWKSPAELLAMHVGQMRERKGPGGGALDAISSFKHRWKLDAHADLALRKLCHKDLRYVLREYNGTESLAEVIESASQEPPEEGTTAGAAPDAPGIRAVGRFNRLELIDPMADCAVFGDANLTFALQLAIHRKALGHVGRVIATTFENYETLKERYKEIDDTIKQLEDHLADVYHEVDCTRIAVDPRFKGMETTLGAVYYNFPHAGAVSGFFDGHPLVNWRHENLMRLFFRGLRFFVKPGGIVKVSSNMGAVGVRYSYIVGSAIENEFAHVETVPFLEWHLHRYGRAYGDRRDAYKRPGEGQGYNVQRAEADMVYTFTYEPSGQVLPKQAIRLPPTFKTIQACPDGPFTNLQGDARRNLAKQLHRRFVTEVSGTHVG